MKLLADDVKSGKEAQQLILSKEYSYTVEDVNNLLTILPVARDVRIYLSVVPLTGSNLNHWANLDGQWEVIGFWSGHLQPDWMSDLGKIFSRTKEAVLSDVKVKPLIHHSTVDATD